jgi:hypothetical protein
MGLSIPSPRSKMLGSRSGEVKSGARASGPADATSSVQKYGQSRMDVSEIFPNVAEHVDDIAFLRSCTASQRSRTGLLS